MTVLEQALVKVKTKAVELEFDRFSRAQRFQHFVQMVSFFVLGATGMAIKFSSTAYASSLVKWLGGFDGLLSIHIFSGSIFIWLALYHILYLIGLLAEGKLAWTMLPTIQDFTDLKQNIKFLLGISAEQPQFGRYSYKEKIEYLAEWWGVFVMAGTGILLWFPGQAGQFVPRWMQDAARVVHSYEATLAILVILTWHLFSVALSPHIFPMSRVWINGKISATKMAEEHPREFTTLTGREVELHHPEPSVFRIGLAIVEMVVYMLVFLFILRALLPAALG